MDKEARRLEKQAQRQAKIAELEARRDQRKADKENAKAEKQAREAALGKVVASELFGMKLVTIYENGFVKVRGLLGGEAEELQAIVATSDITKKTGLGRAVGAVATLGLNTLSPNKRGDVYLVITTDKDVYTLHTDSPTATDIKNAKKLEAAGMAVIARNAPAGSPDVREEPANQAQGKSAAEQIRDMKALLDEGVIDQEEFDRFKASIIG